MPELYVQVPIETDPSVLADIAFSYLQSRYPAWVPQDGQLDTWLISALARQSAELRDVASDVPAAIFRYFGAQLMNLPPIDAVSASIPATLTMKDAVGYSFNPGTLVAGLRDSSGSLRGYQNANIITIAPGSTTAAITLVDTVEGAEGSGLGATGTTMELVNAIERVASVITTAASTGGLDAEEDLDYLSRLAQELSLQAPRPILPKDFAIYSRNIAGVSRACALDTYDAVLGTSGNARTVTVALANAAGQPVGSTIKALVLAYLQAAREVNFLVYVIDPTYTTIDCQWDVTAYPGWDSATVTANVNAAIASVIGPATWGNPPFGDAQAWLQQTTVRFRDLIVAIGKAEGVNDVNFAKIRTGAGAYTEADIALTGAAPLPQLGACTGTVH